MLHIFDIKKTFNITLDQALYNFIKYKNKYAVKRSVMTISKSISSKNKRTFFFFYIFYNDQFVFSMFLTFCSFSCQIFHHLCMCCYR